MIFALTTGISVYIKVDKTSFNSIPLCEIYPSKAWKYIDKIFKEKVEKQLKSEFFQRLCNPFVIK